MSKTFIYVIGQRDSWNNPLPPFKVGVSANPEYRRRTFQVGSPVKLYILALFSFESRDLAFWVERKFHEKVTKHEDYHAHGEWLGLDLFHVRESIQYYSSTNKVEFEEHEI